MSDSKTPQRPDGLPDDQQRTSSQPRVEVEPTPVEPGDYSYSYTYKNEAGSDPAATSSAPTSSMPAVHTETRTVVKTKSKKLPIFLASLLGLVAGGVLVIALVMTGAFRITDTDVEATGASSQKIEIDPEDTSLSEAVAAKSLPSVVSITAQGGADGQGGIGSGVILDEDGNILTNHHVIENADTLVVNTDAGESYEAELVGADPSSDLAVIRIKDADKAELAPIEVGDSDEIAVGEWVMAIGSPFGNEQSVSTGIVSALYRSTALPSASGTSIYANMIQTDAAINPGNSGGALVNDRGELIGINSVIESYSGSSSGVGFAIPVNYAIDIANQIIDGKTPVHPYLGVSLTSVNAYVARQNNLAVDHGAYVAEVTPGGPADKAGIKKGDIVIDVEGTQIASADGLIIALREHEVGDTVKLTVVRGTKDKEIEVELGSDEALQAEQEDTSDGNGSGSGMTEEEFLRYLEEFLGNGGF
ncbi:MAG: trypsin-like peptidase domain-containing protein [Coriobacteriaceae bacterium]|nr:trypsin-like peptidase domain-containing protein [Coriobacteriaceae bacterium]